MGNIKNTNLCTGDGCSNQRALTFECRALVIGNLRAISKGNGKGFSGSVRYNHPSMRYALTELFSQAWGYGGSGEKKTFYFVQGSAKILAFICNFFSDYRRSKCSGDIIIKQRAYKLGRIRLGWTPWINIRKN